MGKVFSKQRLLAELNNCSFYPGIDPEELAGKLSILAGIGTTVEGGITRFPYTDEEKSAKEIFKSWMEEIGLIVREDSLGNIFGVLEGEDPSLPIVLTGSHLDSVPNGGAFDGPLGCLSSLLAMKAITETGTKPKRSIELVVFVDEEGARFGNGLFGSRVMMGEVTASDLKYFKDDQGNLLYDEMKKAGFNPDGLASCYRKHEDIFAFLELHIEQGKRLESENKQIGVVHGIAGPSWGSIIFYGETDHAGNTPMEYRKDTVAAAAEFILEVEKSPRMFSQTAVATVGKITVFPNGSNVISGRTELSVDVRDIDEQARDNLLAHLEAKADEIAKKRGLSFEVEEGIKIPPVIVPEHIQQTIRTASENNGLSVLTVISGAGHDAMSLGRYVPSGMIFVPSHNGKSHSPEEWTSLPDCVNGVQVLKESILSLANQ
ncbi:Zn-dependent hydrolase [Bacillus canaveralius]|uniref:Zn-dependent hydrolase n=1 Tax=Bacillus canaveralius TaxID=1403243 RepID=UPI000F776631|nr:Zn-dependent hydrolase [Bacillus canaveralius]RSK52675.1 Zn-dependent hydrolase [Bacillus canaveralius]